MKIWKNRDRIEGERFGLWRYRYLILSVISLFGPLLCDRAIAFDNLSPEQALEHSTAREDAIALSTQDRGVLDNLQSESEAGETTQWDRIRPLTVAPPPESLTETPAPGERAIASSAEQLGTPSRSLTALNNGDSGDRDRFDLQEIVETGDRVNPISPTADGSILAQRVTFPDIQNHWAQTFIEALAAREIVVGFPDGTFRPDLPIIRAEYAATLRKAFPVAKVRDAIAFNDVPTDYWGYNAVRDAYEIGFMEGYPNQLFRPNQNIPRVEALVSLATGLDLDPEDPIETILSNTFDDAAEIPNFARSQIAAATETGLVVNYPDSNTLNPNEAATRAEVAAFLYQALVQTGLMPPLSEAETASRYVVRYEGAIADTDPSPERPTQTQDLAALRQRFLIDPEPQVQLIPTGIGGAAPGSSSGSPTAFGTNFGRAFVATGFQGRTRYTDEVDGTVSAGFGLGNSRENIGVEVTVSVLSLLGDDAGERGSVSFKVHRLLPNGFAIAGGVENAIVWGSTDAGTSGYGVVSKLFRLKESPAEPFSSITMSVGVGGGRFRSEDDFRNDEGSVNVFGSVGVRVLRPMSLIADWTGQDLTLGASFVPFRSIPLVITPAVTDITGNAGDGARFILGVGYGYQLPF
ncbi:S-layer homology domain-containing protein [Oxynema sp. CENA135]|uniref:S-layer homology domain-containing protein n=1 Tax=Oxynema sp. CENA135 TaxID=984206 RepID=UPI00190B4E84|nr:S-layer homology domain-containing protein [Oxynema sp. CENA135]MBK4729166.1 S-layer homology domain-containing protein [Oxynema sp. CENA135]